MPDGKHVKVMETLVILSGDLIKRIDGRILDSKYSIELKSVEN
jgi:hypothetical protein